MRLRRRAHPDAGAYAAPEQIRGEPLTARADVYSLGVVLRQALAGQELPAAVAELIERSTAPDASDRFVDAGAFADALRLGIRGVPPAVAPAAAPVRNPYKGLRSFQEAVAPDFFGREALTARLVQRLATVNA